MSLWDFLASHTVEQTLFIIAGAIVGAWSIVFALVYAIKKVRLKRAGVGGVEFGEKSPEQPAHANCVHGRDIVVLLKKQAEMITAVRDIRDSILPEQMRYAESRAVELRGLLQKTFLGLLQDEAESGRIANQNHVQSDDYHMYRLCMRAAYEDMRDYLRICFRENHFASKSEQEFRAYIAAKTDELCQNTTDLLNDLYHGKIISRATVYEANKRLAPQIRESLADIFQQARTVAISACLESDKLEQEFETYFSEKIGL